MTARSKADAVEKLDEVANAEGCPIIELPEAQVHSALTDDGELVLDGLGDETEHGIFEFCYAALAQARLAGKNVRAAAILNHRATITLTADRCCATSGHTASA